MAQTKPKAAQFYGVSDNGTDGQFLKTDGTGGMSWDSPITNPTITSIDYPGTQTAADPAGGESVIINGTLFASGITCTVGGTSAVTAFNSATQITITTPAKAAGQYTVEVTNLDGGTASQANFIQYSGVPVWSTAAGNIGSVQSGSTASFQVTATEGSDTIEYAVTTGTLPTGLSLATATGAITGTAPTVSASTTTTFSITATDDENQTSSARSFNITVTPDLPSNYFNVSIYNGSGASQSITTGFAPDFTWIKSRSNATWHCVADTVRGNLSRIFPNSNYQQITNNNGFLSFGSNGFNLDGQGGGGDVNTSGRTFVAWSLKAGGTKVANTQGLINTNVSANTTLGFSIVEYDGATNATSDGSNNSGNYWSVGHGLGATPDLVMVKKLNGVGSWYVGGAVIGSSGTNGNHLVLNATSSMATQSNLLWGGSQTFNNTTFGLGGWDVVNRNGDSYIAYCFTSKPGYSKVGTYTATGSAGSPVVQTGFQPAFVMVKNIDKSQEWIIIDDKRNDGKNSLQPNSANAENTAGDNAISLYSNGFAIAVSGSGVNYQSGDTFIYLAFAADPSTTTPSLANSFNTVLYTGNASTNQISTVGFAPDFTWIKARNTATAHELHDSVRGEPSRLWANENYAASTAYNGFVKLTSNGFDLNNVGSGGNVNRAYNYVAWNWKAGGLASINTDGSITSLVSANQAAGFSIVKYTGNSTVGATIAHGLGAKPELFFIKNLTATSGSRDWIAWCNEDNTKLGYLNYNSTFDASRYSWALNSTQPTSTTITFSNDPSTNGSFSYIAYCFKSITGYSKVGNFSGSGSSGNFQNIGFTPTWIMIKAYQGGGSDWYMLDNKRPGGNTTREFLGANLTGGTYNASETNAMQFVTNGFQFGGSSFNTSGYDYIYLAIKEN